MIKKDDVVEKTSLLLVLVSLGFAWVYLDVDVTFRPVTNSKKVIIVDDFVSETNC